MTINKQKKRLFGTNGVRGVVGEDMTPELVLSIGLALGSMRQGCIGVGRDTRTSGAALVSAVKSGLMAAGCDVVDLGILPTPALQLLVRSHFDAGAMITASHNPPQYNGVKVIESDGTEMSDDETILLEGLIFGKQFQAKDWENAGNETRAPLLIHQYIDSVKRHFPEEIGNGMTVVVDPGSGPASLTTRPILTGLGCRVLTINDTLDGRFPGRMPEPSAVGLINLSKLVLATGAAFGVAHDGDADRAVFIDDKGRYLEENKEFALIADFVCRKRPGIVVTPVSSSHLIEDVSARHDCKVVYTPVGSIYVARKMLELIREGKNVVFGGEGNGGLIFPEHQFCRDGGMTAATMVSLLSITGQSLSSLVDQLPPYYMVKGKIVTSKPEAIVSQVEELFSDGGVDRTDGIRITRGKSWALIRPSGTEPFVRVIVESDEECLAEKFYRDIVDAVAEDAK